MTIHSLHTEEIDITSDIGMVDALSALLRDLESRAAMLHTASTSDELSIDHNPVTPAYFDSMEREIRNAREIVHNWHERKYSIRESVSESDSVESADDQENSPEKTLGEILDCIRDEANRIDAAYHTLFYKANEGAETETKRKMLLDELTASISFMRQGFVDGVNEIHGHIGCVEEAVSDIKAGGES